MTQAPYSRRRLLQGLVATLLIGGVTGGILYYQHLHEWDMPDLPSPDVRVGYPPGVVKRLTGGQAMSRPWNTAELSDSTFPVSPLAPLKEKDFFSLGTYFKVEPKTVLSVETPGPFSVFLESGGEFVFEDSRISSDGELHAQYWTVRKGTFRIKVVDRVPGKHIVQIQLKTGRFILKQGEIGMNIDENGKGLAWVNTGKCVMIMNDGTKRPLIPKGLFTI